jgi:hypothetical protein
MPRDEYYEMKDIAKQKAREADQAAADESTKVISKRESKPLSEETMRTFEPMSEVQRFKRLEELKRQPAPTRELQTMRALEPKSEVLQRGRAPAAAANENRAKQAKK